MSKERKKLEDELVAQKARVAECEASLKEAQQAMQAASAALRNYDRERRRNAKLTPKMIEALRYLSQTGAAIIHNVGWNHQNYCRLGNTRMSYGVFEGLRERELIASETYATFHRSALYTITERGRTRLAEIEKKAQAA